MKVFVAALSQARALQSRAAVVAGGAGRVTSKKSERKAARTLGVVILVFLITFCPYFYPSLAGQEISTHISTWALVSGLLYFNSCLNPLIYAFSIRGSEKLSGSL